MTDETTHAVAFTPEDLPTAKSFFLPHRIVMMLVFAAFVVAVAVFMRWDWLPEYAGRLLSGVGVTLLMLFSTCILGFLFALPIGLVQVTGPWPLKMLAKGFCTVIRGAKATLDPQQILNPGVLFDPS